MKKYILLFAFIVCAPVTYSKDIYYCGGYLRGYSYNVNTFEQQFLNKTQEEACTYETNSGSYTDPMCIKIYNNNVSNYKAGKCKKMSEQIYKQLKNAIRNRNRQQFYEIYNSVK